MFIKDRLRWFFKYKKLEKESIFLSKTSYSSNTKYEGHNYLGNGSRLTDSYIGYGTYIRENCLFKKTKIGRYCSIAPHVHIVYGAHPTSKFVAMHPAFYGGSDLTNLLIDHRTSFPNYKYADNDCNYYVKIGNDVWIGADSIIMSGVNIGDGAVIAAGAVVTKDVLPYTIVGGCPAKEIRKRFSDKQIEVLLNRKWWEKDISWIKENIEIFDDIDIFIDAVDKR